MENRTVNRSRTIRVAITMLICAAAHEVFAQASGEAVVLRGNAGVEAIFEAGDSGWHWVAYQDTAADRRWEISGRHIEVQPLDKEAASVGVVSFGRIASSDTEITLEADLPGLLVTVRRTYSFCSDGRTLRIQTTLRAPGEAIIIRRIALLDVTVSGETPKLTGSPNVSHPVFGERFFAGIEHPSAECMVEGSRLSLAQSPYTRVGQEWVEFPPAVFGSASDEDVATAGEEGLRRAFIRYLDTVRVKPDDMHVHYNDWWTAPIPSSEDFVLQNIAQLRQGLHETTGFFFDSYALDMGWSNPYSVWEIDEQYFPEGFGPIQAMLTDAGSGLGLWVSPSSLYAEGLDNAWLETAGYEVTPNATYGLNACLARGGKYQTALKQAVLKHVRNTELRHVKFDGFIPSCHMESHGHPTGTESYLPIVEGLMDVFDAIRALDPAIALEPTCFGYDASPWWLMHTPFIIGPFGDDSPKGRVPCPEWIESMTTVRDIKNLEGRDAFLMPSTALQCFDIVVQCPGAIQNHAVMAIGRGRWFISSYINPKFMDAGEWRFFADLMAWARANRRFLQEPVPVGGDPAKREAYGYAFTHPKRAFYCLRNPWIAETELTLADTLDAPREVRMLYPRRQTLARPRAGEPTPPIHLGPYETRFIEIVPCADSELHGQPGPQQAVSVSWQPSKGPVLTRLTFEDEPPLGATWSNPDGEALSVMTFALTGDLEVRGASSAELLVLCEGQSIQAAFPELELTIDDAVPKTTASRSVGAFHAGGHHKEDWVWYSAPIASGRRQVALKVRAPAPGAKFGVFVRGDAALAESPPFVGSGPAFPQYRPQTKRWSRTVVPVTSDVAANTVSARRSVVPIDGVYLDTLPWREATSGWWEVRRNRSVKGEAMTMGGRLFHRGIGAHSRSRVVFDLPQGYSTFAATIGCDQKALAGTVVFVIYGDDKEIFRSPIFRATTAPMDIRVPIEDVRELALILEDGGDRINADHGNWANAQLLRQAR